MSLASGNPDAPLRRGEEVMAKLPFEGVIIGELMDPGPRCTIARDNGETVEVDEANVWRNGDGYSVRAIHPDEEDPLR